MFFKNTNQPNNGIQSFWLFVLASSNNNNANDNKIQNFETANRMIRIPVYRSRRSSQMARQTLTFLNDIAMCNRNAQTLIISNKFIFTNLKSSVATLDILMFCFGFSCGSLAICSVFSVIKLKRLDVCSVLSIGKRMNIWHMVRRIGGHGMGRKMLFRNATHTIYLYLNIKFGLSCDSIF